MYECKNDRLSEQTIYLNKIYAFVWNVGKHTSTFVVRISPFQGIFIENAQGGHLLIQYISRKWLCGLYLCDPRNWHTRVVVHKLSSVYTVYASNLFLQKTNGVVAQSRDRTHLTRKNHYLVTMTTTKMDKCELRHFVICVCIHQKSNSM